MFSLPLTSVFLGDVLPFFVVFPLLPAAPGFTAVVLVFLPEIPLPVPGFCVVVLGVIFVVGDGFFGGMIEKLIKSCRKFPPVTTLRVQSNLISIDGAPFHRNLLGPSVPPS